jgi:hypothetical protein
MKIKKTLVLVSGTIGALPVLAQAPPSDDIRWLDSACLSQQTQACIDSIMPVQTALGPGLDGCAAGYVVRLNPQIPRGEDCVRGMLTVADANTFSTVVKACEISARVNYSTACVTTVHADELVSALRADWRKVLSGYCEIFKGDEKLCHDFNGPPPVVQ